MPDQNDIERQRWGGPSPWAGKDSRTDAQKRVARENLATAESLISTALSEFWENQDKPITDPSKTIFGPTLPQAIVIALVKAGLIDACLPSDLPYRRSS